MAFKNAVFELESRKFRLLHAEAAHNVGWCIDIADPKAWPVEFPLSQIDTRPLVEAEHVVRASLSDTEMTMKNRAWSHLKPLLDAHQPPSLFHPSARKSAISAYCREGTCTEPTIYKYLRRYWQGGQIPAALSPRFGTPKASSEHLTAHRGRPSDRYQGIYQVTNEDTEKMRKVIETFLHVDRRRTMPAAHEELLKNHYLVADGNGEMFIRPEGEYPSLKQLRYFYQKHYDFKLRKEKKVGPREFNLNHRAVTGLVSATTDGVGHRYEVDSTILECTAVSKHDRNTIIGKPTLYCVICRKSRLIVGFYLGMEHASWIAAMQSIFSLAEDKRELCARYGVQYIPEEWPAHGVFPGEFLADRGSDWTSTNSMALVRELGCTIDNLPAGRAEMKPIVENCHKLLLAQLRKVDPSSDPDANARKRQKEGYRHNASATLEELTKYTLEAIILHNTVVAKGYRKSPEELTRGLVATPINIWNDGIVERSGLLAKFTEEQVRYLLLPREKARVSKHGIEFKHCVYISDVAVKEKWFERARSESFSVEVSYDPRLVDAIYVHPLHGRGEPQIATISARTIDVCGRSFAEVAFLEKIRREGNLNSHHDRVQKNVDYRSRNRPIADAALEEMKAASKGKPRRLRRLDVAGAREAARTEERAEQSLVRGSNWDRTASIGTAAEIDRGEPQNVSAGSSAASSPAPARMGLSMQERVAALLARQKTTTYQPNS